MALDQIDVGRAPARLPVSRPHGAKLALGVGREQAAVDVVREADPGDHAVNPVAIAEGVAQPLEHEHPRAFAHDQPIGLGPERRGHARGGQGPKLGESHLGIERVGPRQPAGEHRVGPAFEQLVGRQLERIERRGAGRVERVSPAAEPEPLGHQPRRQPRRPGVPGLERLQRPGLDPQRFLERPAQGRSGDLRSGFGRQDDVAEDHADLRSVHGLQSRVEPRRPGRVQGQMKRRVEPGHQRRVEIEPGGIEFKRLDEAAPRRIDVVRFSDRRVMGVGRVEPPSPRRDFPGRGHARLDVGPEPRQVGSVGEDPPDPDDRHPFIPPHGRPCLPRSSDSGWTMIEWPMIDGRIARSSAIDHRPSRKERVTSTRAVAARLRRKAALSEASITHS